MHELGWPGCGSAPSVGCYRPGVGRPEVMELPGPGPRQAVRIKIREVSFGP